MTVILFQKNGKQLRFKRVFGWFEMKNAYCILAHNEPDILKILVSLLDDENNDIYIHLDKKASCFDEKNIIDVAKMSKVMFIPRRNIGWGGKYD